MIYELKDWSGKGISHEDLIRPIKLAKPMTALFIVVEMDILDEYFRLKYTEFNKLAGAIA